MPKLIVDHDALVDVDEIYSYMRLRSPKAARKLVQSIRAKYRLIARQPTIGWVSEPHGSDVRGMTVPPYVIYYLLSESGVTILRVMLEARDRWSMSLR